MSIGNVTSYRHPQRMDAGLSDDVSLLSTPTSRLDGPTRSANRQDITGSTSTIKHGLSLWHTHQREGV